MSANNCLHQGVSSLRGHAPSIPMHPIIMSLDGSKKRGPWTKYSSLTSRKSSHHRFTVCMYTYTISLRKRCNVLCTEPLRFRCLDTVYVWKRNPRRISSGLFFHISSCAHQLHSHPNLRQRGGCSESHANRQAGCTSRSEPSSQYGRQA